MLTKTTLYSPTKVEFGEDKIYTTLALSKFRGRLFPKDPQLGKERLQIDFEI